MQIAFYFGGGWLEGIYFQGFGLVHDGSFLFLSFRNLMNHIGNHAPDHEAVGFIYPDRGEVLVPWNEPAEGAALIHLELLDGEFAIYEGDDEIAV